jgi:methionyl-tRNA formyltransferase
MQINAGLDTGDMLLKDETEIGPDETAVELGQRLATMGADLLVRTLDGLAHGTISAQPQNDQEASFAPLLKKEDGVIDWKAKAAVIHNQVRGLQPWPGASTTFRGQPLHIWRSHPRTEQGSHPGRFLGRNPLVVACGSGSLELIEVQMEGRRRMSSADFANGQRLTDNDFLGAATN